MTCVGGGVGALPIAHGLTVGADADSSRTSLTDKALIAARGTVQDTDIEIAFFVIRSSLPRVYQVVPDRLFRHLVHSPREQTCPAEQTLPQLPQLVESAARSTQALVHRVRPG